ncbi:N-acetylmuramoyl-L-alanine amidase [Clostridiaceae bacterium UIB06]|uniref:N-acetylmuramoyl-L-alanine amidase n=1 Tax=Clostridium thailandense TaxID=2794346 RepID=A0A949WQG6_9CLOT|nr:N-acetylmuramoyl-L-alanine amidase [Clostridium thailandense]MBV7272720.1 N-acetylmuramoyl-L-alanine amidase [Clostridium thailandense]MCH5135886.1 N-acetylmuramoyl-L-alanine amidase [Clostridiaceae bacterium UIB06]
MKNKGIYVLFMSMIIFILMTFIKVNVVQADTIYDDQGTKTNIELDKSWTIKFNQKLDANTVNSSCITVTDENGQDIGVDLNLGSDGSSIVVTPKVQYSFGKTYNLVIKDGLKGENKSNLIKPAKMTFTTKNNTVDNSQKLTVCIDAGHGGPDLGSVSPSGVQEKDIDLSIALKVGKILENNGINVVYTRKDDNVSWSKDNLQPRFDIANNAKADFFISIRCNTYPDNPEAGGTETYYRDSDSRGQKLAQTIQDDLIKSTSLNNRGIKVGLDQHQILRGTTGTPIMVELGFMSNDQEAKLLTTSDYQNKSALAIANGILECRDLKNSVSTEISSVPDTTASIIVGRSFSLPTTVNATMSDGSVKKVSVVWNSTTVDTSKEGVFTYEGATNGYAKNVRLILTVGTKSSDTVPVICIDPGHGLGSDTGATGINNLQEDDVTLAVGLKAGKILENHGVKVVYTRTEDMRSTPMDVTSSLQRRCDISNNANAKYFVSIHNNSADAESASGTETWDNPGNEESSNLAQNVQNSIVQEVGMYDRGLKDGYGRGLYVIKNTDAPAILIELGFLSNNGDNAKLASDEYQQKFAQAIADGILKTLGMQ